MCECEAIGATSMLSLIRNAVSLVIGGTIDPEQEGHKPVRPEAELCDSDDRIRGGRGTG